MASSREVLASIRPAHWMTGRAEGDSAILAGFMGMGLEKLRGWGGYARVKLSAEWPIDLLRFAFWFREDLKEPLEKPGKDRKLVGFGLEPYAEDWIAD